MNYYSDFENHTGLTQYYCVYVFKTKVLNQRTNEKIHHILAIITLGILTLLTSCSSDDNNPIIKEPTVIGKWGLYATDLKVELDGEVFIDSEDVPEEGIEYHFKENGIVDVLYFDPDTKQEEEMRTVSYQITDDKLKIENIE